MLVASKMGQAILPRGMSGPWPGVIFDELKEEDAKVQVHVAITRETPKYILDQIDDVFKLYA